MKTRGQKRKITAVTTTATATATSTILMGSTHSSTSPSPSQKKSKSKPKKTKPSATTTVSSSIDTTAAATMATAGGKGGKSKNTKKTTTTTSSTISASASVSASSTSTSASTTAAAVTTKKTAKTAKKKVTAARIGPEADAYQPGTNYDAYTCTIKVRNAKNWNTTLSSGERNYLREQTRLRSLQIQEDKKTTTKKKKPTKKTVKEDTTTTVAAAITNTQPPSTAPPPLSWSQQHLRQATTAEDLFHALACPEDATVIDLEGIATLCEGLALDPEADIRVLLLIWKFQCCPGPHDADDDDAASQRGNGGDGGGGVPGQISQQEFLRGCSRFQIYSLHTMQTRFLPSLDTGFLDRHEFKGFYKVSVIYIYTETVY